MPSQFQPYYPSPVRMVQPTATTPATPASGQGAGIDKLLKAIAAQKQQATAEDLYATAQGLLNQPDNSGAPGNQGVIPPQINQGALSPIDNLVLSNPGSYLNA